jgi:hypothetical protein
LDDLRGFLKYGNHVARFSFPFIALREKNPGFDERKMDDLIIPSTPLPPEPEEMQGNPRFRMIDLGLSRRLLLCGGRDAFKVSLLDLIND